MRKLLIVIVAGLVVWGYYTQKVRPEQQAWAQATATDDIASLLAYTAVYTSGPHTEQANQRVSALRNDDGPYERAITEGNGPALDAFLRQYPGHRREREARALLASGDYGPRDLLDLLQQGKVELSASGNGIESVSVTVSARTAYPLQVEIPAGLLFVPADRSDQTMMTTESTTVRLVVGSPSSATVPVACTNWAKDVPDKADRMTVRRVSNQNLAFVAPLLAKSSQYPVRQAMVWIMSDNTNYHDLGKLIQGFCFMDCEAYRIIKADEAAQALRLIVEGGADMRSWRIWRDRSQIHAGIQDTELKTWFAANVLRR
ncbi:MAG: hypothetical protein JSU08_15485 [Acidobacteria bacterium]|nr:hypothetical protein [Acidobacteriota bacterium]